MTSWMFIRAIRGPIILIVLGTLFAMDNLRNLSFERTWPILIILFGVMKLLERLAARQAAPPIQPGAGGMPPQGGF